MISLEKFSGKNKKLIGISGKIGTGKDTICQIIQFLDNYELQDIFTNVEEYIDAYKKFGPSNVSDVYTNVKFAYKIKQIVSILTGISISDLEKPEVKESYLSECWNKKIKKINWFKPMSKGIYSRCEIEERITVREFMQSVGTDALKNIVHPNIWINSLYADFKPDNKYIISDVRFIDEAESVLERNGILIRVNRNTNIEHKYKNHISETQLDNYDNWDIILNNNGNIKDLKEQLEKYLL